MPQLSENGRRVLERWTLLAGGIEMLIGASMTAFPDVFPWWLTVLALAIAALTVGVGLTLIWTDVTKLRTLIGAERVGLIGPTISGLGLLLIVGLGVWFFSQAPKGFLAGSNAVVVLVAAILVVSFVFLTFPSARSNGKQSDQPLKPSRDIGEKVPQLSRTAFLLSTAAVADHYKRKLQEGLDWWEKHPRTGPFTNDFEIRTEVMRVQEFIKDLQANLAPSHWTAELYRVVQSAEQAADHEVMQKKTAPEGLSPFEYRRFHIACTQYERIGAFLQRSIEEAKSQERQMVQMLRERPELHK